MKTNKDLDLTTQQVLLAQVRCDEISEDALTVFNDQVKPRKQAIESGTIISELGEMMRTWLSQALCGWIFSHVCTPY